MDSNEIKAAINALSPEQRRELLAWLKERNRPLWLAWLSRLRAKSKPARIPPGLRRAVAGTLVGLIAFAVVEAAIFRSGWYGKYLEPVSMAGQMEYHLFWLRRMPPQKVPDVLVLGDSRIAEGFSVRIASAAVAGRVHFVNLAMLGSTPRVWYYTLRNIGKDLNRFSAIVIPFVRYSDLDAGEDLPNRVSDLNFLAAHLHWSDCRDFARSFTDTEVRRDALAECLFRGVALRPDIYEFLSDIPHRLKRAKDWRNNGLAYSEGYTGRPEDLKGLTMDEVSGTIQFPPGAKQSQIDTARATLTPPVVPQTGAVTAYRRRWIGAILELLKTSPARVIFIQIPNAPLPLADSTVPAQFIDSVKVNPRLTVLPVDTFRDVQRPELFFDGMHLNSTGRRLFSVELAKAVVPILETK